MIVLWVCYDNCNWMKIYMRFFVHVYFSTSQTQWHEIICICISCFDVYWKFWISYCIRITFIYMKYLFKWLCYSIKKIYYERIRSGSKLFCFVHIFKAIIAWNIIELEYVFANIPYYQIYPISKVNSVKIKRDLQ